ncbi:MAG: hypothetical protein MUO59_07015 [Actinobacteria bacterium]|nr:hypothetical protein [Actinomycetota bacterium]
MKIEKQKVKVKIATHSAIIIGHIHIMPGGRISDYINPQVNKLIPITEADIYSIDNNIKKDINISGSYAVCFINAGNIKMMVAQED